MLYSLRSSGFLVDHLSDLLLYRMAGVGKIKKRLDNVLAEDVVLLPQVQNTNHFALLGNSKVSMIKDY